MRQLDRAEVIRLLDSVQDDGGTLPVHVRLTRLYYPEPKLIYAGPATLMVQRGPRLDGNTLACISVEDLPGGLTWAEYGRAMRVPLKSQIGDDGSLVAEDYLLELLTTD